VSAGGRAGVGRVNAPGMGIWAGRDGEGDSGCWCVDFVWLCRPRGCDSVDLVLWGSMFRLRREGAEWWNVRAACGA